MVTDFAKDSTAFNFKAKQFKPPLRLFGPEDEDNKTCEKVFNSLPVNTAHQKTNNLQHCCENIKSHIIIIIIIWTAC